MGWDIRTPGIPFWVSLIASTSVSHKQDVVREEQGYFFWRLAHPKSSFIPLGTHHSGNSYRMDWEPQG